MRTSARSRAGWRGSEYRHERSGSRARGHPRTPTVLVGAHGSPRRLGVAPVVTNAVMFANPEDWGRHRLIAAIGANTTLSATPPLRLSAAEAWLKSEAELLRHFPDVPDAIDRAVGVFPVLGKRLTQTTATLSGGEQQMVAVARAMSGNVKLLLLDEPFEGLAPTVILELFGVFDQLRQHSSIVIVEHNLDLVLALADRVFALERGAVFHRGPAAPLLTDLDYRKKILWL